MADEPKPTRKPKRRRVLSALFALAAIGLLAFGGNAWFVRHRELVWWRSGPLDGEGHRVRMLIPAGWKLVSRAGPDDTGLLQVRFVPQPAVYPSWLKWLSRPVEDYAALYLIIGLRQHEPIGTGRPQNLGARVLTRLHPTMYISSADLVTTDGHITAKYSCSRTDKAAFDRTRQAICNSMRVE